MRDNQVVEQRFSALLGRRAGCGGAQSLGWYACSGDRPERRRRKALNGCPTKHPVARITAERECRKYTQLGTAEQNNRWVLFYQGHWHGETEMKTAAFAHGICLARPPDRARQFGTCWVGTTNGPSHVPPRLPK